MVANVQQAKKDLVAFKLSKAVQAVRDVQASIDALDATFSVDNLPALKEVAKQINSLSLENKAILDLTAYNNLMAEYNAYLDSLEGEMQPVVNVVSSVTYNASAILKVAAALSGFAVVALNLLKRKIV